MRHIIRMCETRNTNKILVGKPEGRSHSKYLDIDGRIILERIVENRVGSFGLTPARD